MLQESRREKNISFDLLIYKYLCQRMFCLGWGLCVSDAYVLMFQYDLSASQFSPDGRVFQVEYAQKAVENSGYVSEKKIME